MNRVLFSRDEISDGVAVFGGERADHVLDVLHGEVGQTFKTGELDGRIGTSEILSIEKLPDGARRVAAKVCHDRESPRPWADLILAPPRPRALKRLLPQLAAMGVGRIVLVGAGKVEKDFWGATLLKPEIHLPLLVDGLMQAGTSIVPRVETRRSFSRFVEDELDAVSSGREKFVAHPYGTAERVAPASPGARVVLAVGPEGGWLEREVEALEAHGFLRRSLGPRILRTETAAVALLARLNPE